MYKVVVVSIILVQFFGTKAAAWLESTFKSGPAELFALKVFELISKAGGPAELFAPCDLSL
jgi:hypothetical protein